MPGCGRPKWGIIHEVADIRGHWVFGDACDLFCLGVLAVGSIGQRIKKQTQINGAVSGWGGSRVGDRGTPLVI